MTNQRHVICISLFAEALIWGVRNQGQPELSFSSWGTKWATCCFEITHLSGVSLLKNKVTNHYTPRPQTPSRQTDLNLLLDWLIQDIRF